MEHPLIIINVLDEGNPRRNFNAEYATKTELQEKLDRLKRSYYEIEALLQNLINQQDRKEFASRSHYIYS